MGLRNILSTIKQTRNLRKVIKPIAEILDALEGDGCYINRVGNRWKIVVQPSSGGGGLPSGGLEYQVLQRDDSIDAVWDWVRWP
jgi:hypothetical protein